MKTRIQRWGNSLALRIPKAFAAQASLEENSSVDLELDGDTLVVRAARREWALEELVDCISQSNVHRAVSWGGTRGSEIW